MALSASFLEASIRVIPRIMSSVLLIISGGVTRYSDDCYYTPVFPESRPQIFVDVNPCNLDLSEVGQG